MWILWVFIFDSVCYGLTDSHRSFFGRTLYGGLLAPVEILFLTLAVPLNNPLVELVAISLLLEQTDGWTFAGLTSIWSQENTDGAARSGLRGQWGLVCVDKRWQAPLSSSVMWKQSDRWFISHTEQRRHLKGRFHLDLILLLQIEWFNSGLLWSQFVVQLPPPQTPWPQAVSHGVWAERH